MPMTAISRSGLAKLILGGTTWANGSGNPGFQTGGGDGQAEVSLYTGTPDDAGDSTINESVDASYARQAIFLNGTYFNVTVDPPVLIADLVFPALAGGGETYTDVGLCVTDGANGELWLTGHLPAPVAVATGQQPVLRAGTPIVFV